MRAIRELTFLVVAAFLAVVGFGVLYRNGVIAFPDLSVVTQPRAADPAERPLIVTSQTRPLSGLPKLEATGKPSSVLVVPTAAPTEPARQPPAEPTQAPAPTALPTRIPVLEATPSAGETPSVPPTVVLPTATPLPPPTVAPTAAPTAQQVAQAQLAQPAAVIPAPATAKVQTFRGDMYDGETGTYLATVTFRMCTHIGPLDVNLNDSCETAKTVSERCNILWEHGAAPGDDTGILTDNKCQPASQTFNVPMPVQIRP